MLSVASPTCVQCISVIYVVHWNFSSDTNLIASCILIPGCSFGFTWAYKSVNFINKDMFIDCSLTSFNTNLTIWLVSYYLLLQNLKIKKWFSNRSCVIQLQERLHTFKICMYLSFIASSEQFCFQIRLCVFSALLPVWAIYILLSLLNPTCCLKAYCLMYTCYWVWITELD